MALNDKGGRRRLPDYVGGMFGGDPKNPSTPSSAYRAMMPYWKMVRAVMGGVQTMREAGEDYLPKFEAEGITAYDARIRTARMTNVFRDIIENLISHPFAKPVTLPEGTDSSLVDFAMDVDGGGKDLHVFAHRVFRAALSDGVTHIFVDYTREAAEARTVAEERAMGARPFWRHYRALDVVSMTTDDMGKLMEVRLVEMDMERDGFAEKMVHRVRVLEKTEAGVEWMVYRKIEDGMQPTTGYDRQSGTDPMATPMGAIPGEWEIEDQGTLGLDEIPLVTIRFGEDIDGLVDPPLRGAAELQIELYQQENGLKNIRRATAYPMLAGNGVTPEIDDNGAPKALVVGPNQVLYGGRGADGMSAGSWTYIEPSGTSLTFLRDDIKDTIEQLRELGRQPLTAQSPNLTVISAATAAEKGKAAIHAWVGILVNGLRDALDLTSRWMGMEPQEVAPIVNQDFDLHAAGQDTFGHVLTMEKDRLISREAVIDEAMRRGILLSGYDADEDMERIDPRETEEEGMEE